MKRILQIVTGLVVMASMAWPQQPFVPIPADQLQLQVEAPQSPAITANYIGAQGSQTFYYWVIANYPGGKSPNGNPAVVQNVLTLSSTNKVNLSWTRPNGVSSFTIVRTVAPSLNACTSCLLANNTTATSITDTGGSIGNFNPVAPLGVARATITIDNKSRANPFVTISGSPGSTFRQVPLIAGTFTAGSNAVFDANGNLVDGASGGGLPDPGSNGIVVRTAPNTDVARTITAGTNISVSNGDGVAGNPVINATGGTINAGADQDLICYQGAGTTVGPCSTAQILYGGVGNIVGATTGAAAAKFGAAGTSLLPAWTFGGDLDTGFWRIGANNFGLALGGVSQVEFGGGNGTARVWDQTTVTGSTELRIRDGAGQSSNTSLQFYNNTGTAQGGFYNSGTIWRAFGADSVLAVTSNAGPGSTPAITFSNSSTRGGTSGTLTGFQFTTTFAPTSGTSVYNHVVASPTVNQTGGASGISRGVYVNPTLTAAADWRAIEVADGGGVVKLAGYTVATLPTTAPNGSMAYATDGTQGTLACTGGSTGTVAFRLNGAWLCF